MVDLKDVEHIAKLARLTLTESEKAQYAKQLSSIMDYIKQLEEVNTDGVEPMLTPSPIEGVLRPDKVAQNMDIEEKLKNAPEKSGHLVKVPPVVG